jgi:hypothetical protein
VVRGLFDAASLGTALELRPERRTVLTRTVAPGPVASTSRSPAANARGRIA